jgi:hypothetical protein
MNPYTGELHELHELTDEHKKMINECLLVPVVRDLTALERLNKQINLYSPCGCGSGKKFKFCCHIAPHTPHT